MAHKKYEHKILKLIYYSEIIIGILLGIALIVSILMLGYTLFTAIPDVPNNSDWFSSFLQQAFAVIVGIEFLKMLIKQTPGSVLEVLFFSIARQMIVEHTTAVHNLLSVIAIAIIFGIQRYLMIHSFDDEEEESGDKHL